MNAEIISYLELCTREGAHLQHGMNWRILPTHSVFLMSMRKGAPYDDRIEDEGRTLIYEGHDAPKNMTDQNPKKLINPVFFPVANQPVTASLQRLPKHISKVSNLLSGYAFTKN